METTSGTGKTLPGLPHKESVIGFLLGIAAVISLTACRPVNSRHRSGLDDSEIILTITSMFEGPAADFEMQRLNQFAARRKNIRIRHIPAFESDDAQLHMYKQLLRDRSPQPDIFDIDVIWPGMVGDDLIDLKPYFQSELQDFPAELLSAYTVHGRLVAIPTLVDSGVLYYRSDLLRKYGFTGPPETWDDLERMAEVIQHWERKRGHTNFWGYVWQGSANEALTCNALEWQVSEGGGHIIEPDGTVSVANPNAIRALERAISWIGRISPPGIAAYSEDDSLNVYVAGNAAFMREWTSVAALVQDRVNQVPSSIALLPGGQSGRNGTLGGSAVAVSNYSEHRDEAIAAARDLVSADSQAKRFLQIGIPPTRLSVASYRSSRQQAPQRSQPFTAQILKGLTARPSVVTGLTYDRVSEAYYLAVHSALTAQVPAATALNRLQTELERITKTHVSPQQDATIAGVARHP